MQIKNITPIEFETEFDIHDHLTGLWFGYKTFSDCCFEQIENDTQLADMLLIARQDEADILYLTNF